MEYTLESLMKNDGFICPSCGRRHFGLLGDCIVGDNAIESLPSVLEKYSAKYPYVLCDINTYKAAGERVCAVLDSCGIKYFCHIIGRDRPAPDEKTVGEAFMFCPNECDSVLAVGGGVINDTGKIIAAQKHIPDIIIGTAPSMDGFASGTSSMERCGLKISLPTKCPDVVIGEPEILANAPKRMILSGIGDILAKYVSVV